MATLSIEGRNVQVDDSFLKLSPAAELEIVMAEGAGRIQGVVYGDDNRTSLIATVLLFPATGIPPSHIRHVVIDRDGRFEIRGIPPGQYLIAAFDSLESDSWFEPDFLKAIRTRCQSIEIKENTEETRRLIVLPH